MRRSPIIAASAACLMVVPVVAPVGAAEAPDDGGCNSHSCVERVQVKRKARCRGECRERVARRLVRRRWQATVRRYGAGRLDARVQCEAGHNGGYRLSTTGNGFWFGGQFEPRAWGGAGGRLLGGVPVGRWSRMPSRLEQRFRMVVWEGIHPGDAWPNCP